MSNITARVRSVFQPGPIPSGPYDGTYWGPRSSIVTTAGKSVEAKTAAGGSSLSLHAMLPGTITLPPGTRGVRFSTAMNTDLVGGPEKDPDEGLLAVIDGGRYLLIREQRPSQEPRPETRESSLTPGQHLPLPEWATPFVPDSAKIIPPLGETEVKITDGLGRTITLTLVGDTALDLVREDSAAHDWLAQVAGHAPTGQVFKVYDVTELLARVAVLQERHASGPRTVAPLRFKTVGMTAHHAYTSTRRVEESIYGKGGSLLGFNSYPEFVVEPGATCDESGGDGVLVITSGDEILHLQAYPMPGRARDTFGLSDLTTVMMAYERLKQND